MLAIASEGPDLPIEVRGHISVGRADQQSELVIDYAHRVHRHVPPISPWYDAPDASVRPEHEISRTEPDGHLARVRIGTEPVDDQKHVFVASHRPGQQLCALTRDQRLTEEVGGEHDGVPNWTHAAAALTHLPMYAK
jgi:hypothetical protein